MNDEITSWNTGINSVTLVDIWHILCRKFWTLLIVLVVCTVGFSGISFLMNHNSDYVSTATLLLTPNPIMYERTDLQNPVYSVDARTILDLVNMADTERVQRILTEREKQNKGLEETLTTERLTDSNMIMLTLQSNKDLDLDATLNAVITELTADVEKFPTLGEVDVVSEPQTKSNVKDLFVGSIKKGIFAGIALDILLFIYFILKDDSFYTPDSASRNLNLPVIAVIAE